MKLLLPLTFLPLACAIRCSSVDDCAALLKTASSSPFSRLALAVGNSLLAAASASPSLSNTTDQTYCPDQGAFDLVPLSMATLSPASPSNVFGNTGCFRAYVVAATFHGSNASGGVTVTLKGSNPSTLLCSDAFLLGTSYSLSLPVEVSTLSPTANLSFPQWASPDEAADVALRGVRVGLLPCGLLGSITSLLNTVNIFSPLSGREADLVASNERFLHGRAIWNGPSKGPLVPFPGPQALPASAINSGDYFAILRYDGLDPMIAFGTGFGATGHSAVAAWRGAGAGRKLWVLESTDRDPFGPAVYFGSGIIKTPYEQWIALATNASYNVALLPLQNAYAAAFNEDALWAWFDGVEGTVSSDASHWHPCTHKSTRPTKPKPDPPPPPHPQPPPPPTPTPSMIFPLNYKTAVRLPKLPLRGA
jgi:hypothetical protein